MTDEQIWLLQFGRGWVPWYEVVDGPVGDQTVLPLYERLVDSGKIEIHQQAMKMRLKPQEKDEPIRV